jgi:small subunit ribosomal protein S17
MSEQPEQTQTSAPVAATKPARNLRPRQVGVVTSAKPNKTIRVEVPFLTQHPKYGKYIRRRTVLHAHDEKNEAREGDRVEVMACRPISKTKSWRLIRIVAPAAGTRTADSAASGA